MENNDCDVYITIPATEVVTEKSIIFTKKEWNDFGCGLMLIVLIAIFVIISAIVFLIIK